MAFCTKCGRPLQDGEVCLCQAATQPQVTPVTPVQVSSVQAAASPAQAAVINQPTQPNVFLVFFKELWAIVIGVLKIPVATINTYVQKADVKISCTLIGISAFVAALVTLFGLLQAKAQSSSLYDLDNLDLSNITSLYDQYSGTSYTFGYIFKQMCYSAVLIIAVAAAIALVIMIAVNTYGKAKATYLQGVAIVSLTAILAIPAAILAYIFGAFGVSFFLAFGGWISVFASAVGAIYIFIGVRVVCKDENKLPFIAGLCAVGAAMARYLIGLMF